MGQTPVSYHNPELQITCHVIALHPDRDQVMLIEQTDGYTLPGFLAQEHATGATLHINRAMLQRFDMQTVVLRHVDDRSTDSRNIDRFYWVDVLSPSNRDSSSAHFVAVSELDETGMPPVLLQHIHTCADDRQQGQAPYLRLPWSQPGWYSAATQWIAEQVEAIGSAQAGAVEQITGWEQSCVLRVPTKTGRLFFKALPGMYAVELCVLDLLAPQFGDSIPATVAVSTKNRWLLMEDFGGHPLMECPDGAAWLSAIRTYASMQRSMEHHVDQMVAVGVPARPLGDLVAHVTDLLDDDGALLCGQARGLTPEEREQIRAALPEIDTHVQCLERLGIPDTLEHGDLHAHNINVRDDGLVFYDWTLTAVTHPFLSMAYLEHFLAGKQETPPVSVESLRETYLAHWSDMAQLADLRRGLRSAMVLLPLYWALTYFQFIMPFLEPRDRWLRDKGVPFHLRQFLSHALRAD